MKTQLTKCRKQGSVLVITMSVLAVAVLALASYLITIQYEVGSVSRSQTWNSAISVAEAGMEEGMATINYGAPSIIVNPWAWTNMLTTAGWTNYMVGTTNYASITRSVYGSAAGSNSYTVTINWSGTNAPTLTASGVVNCSTIPWVFSSLMDHSYLAVAGSGSTTGSDSSTAPMGRKIQVTTVLSPLFTAGIVCKSTIDLKGNNVTIDSFDSSDPTHSVGGQWSATCRKANGNVATDSIVTNSLSIGNANIFGYVYTGPGSAENCVYIQNNGSVGDLAWVSNSTSGIENGHWAGNYNMAMPDVGAPNTNGWTNSLGAVTGTSNVVSAGFYVVNIILHPLYITGPTVIWVNSASTVNLGVTIATTNNASLTLYVGQATGSNSLAWSGQGTCNIPGYARNLQIYGLPSLKSVDFHGNAAWIGTLYAPEAAFVGGGGGNNTQDTAGALCCSSISLNGHWNFHYDESLTGAGASRGWIATGWKEVPYP